MKIIQFFRSIFSTVFGVVRFGIAVLIIILVVAVVSKFLLYVPSKIELAEQVQGRGVGFFESVMRLLEPAFQAAGLGSKNANKEKVAAQKPGAQQKSNSSQEDSRSGKGMQADNHEPVATPGQPPSHAKTEDEIEDDAWKAAKETNAHDAYETYLSRYPSGRYAEQAKMNLAALKKPTQIAHPANRPDKTIGEPEMVHIPGKSYELGKYEVTQGEWKAVMGSNPSHFPGCGDNCPVERVSWNDVHEFISKLNSKTGKQYRLPIEAEWEYACYGGSQTEYCGSDNIDGVAWYEINSSKTTHPGGLKRANGYGLHDMSGNVGEWMENKYDSEHGWHALRGGSYIDKKWNVRAADRGYYDPAARDGDYGFRLARTINSSASASEEHRLAVAHGNTAPRKAVADQHRLQAEAAQAATKDPAFVSQGGLTWMPVTFMLNWQNAHDYCAKTTIKGQTGWRLPTKEELGALYASGAMKGQGWTLGYTWSSTRISARGYYFVGLNSGIVTSNFETSSYYVSCVH